MKAFDSWTRCIRIYKQFIEVDIYNDSLWFRIEIFQQSILWYEPGHYTGAADKKSVIHVLLIFYNRVTNGQIITHTNDHIVEVKKIF